MNLTDLICTTFCTTRSTFVYDHVFIYSLSYLSGGYTAFEYQALVKPFCVTQSAKDFRLTLLKYKSVHFGLKLLVLRLANLPSPDFSDFKSISREVDVDPVDARQAYRILAEQPSFRNRLRKESRRICRVMPLTEEYVVSLFNRLYPAVLSYVKAISFRTLRFVARSSNLDMTDLHSELMVKVVQAYYRLVPSDKSEPYLVNYLRRVAHNHAMNMIQSHTTQKRGRLLKVGTDAGNNPIFSLTVVSENQLNVSAMAGEEVGYADIGETDDQMEKFELSFSITQLLDKYRQRTRKYRFLMILMGQDDGGFTEWLQGRRLCKESDTNSDLQMEVSSDQYLQWVCEFMHIGQRSANVFLLRVKKELGFDYVGSTRKAA